MNNELQQHKTADTVKWILTLVAFILVGIMLIGIILGWFEKKELQGDKKEETTQTEDAGGLCVAPASGEGMKLSAVMLSAEEAIAAQAESSYTLTATILPDIATNKNVDWEIAFVNPASAWASGKTTTDYVILTPASSGAQTATVLCKAPFGEQMVITARSRENQNIAATCTVDYVQKVQSVSLAIGNVSVNLGGNTDVKIYIGEDNRNKGGKIALSVGTSSVYTIAETITKSVSFSNSGDGGGSTGYFNYSATNGGPYGSYGNSCDSIENAEGKSIYFDRRIFSAYNFCRTGSGWQGSNLVSYSNPYAEMSVSDMKYYLDMEGEQQKILWTVHVVVTGSKGNYRSESTSDIRLTGSEGGTNVTGLNLDENNLKF